jgi:Kelch motif
MLAAARLSMPRFVCRTGRVLVPGGHSAPHTETNSADIFDPETGTWAPAGLMNAARAGHVAIVLRGNRGEGDHGADQSKDWPGNLEARNDRKGKGTQRVLVMGGLTSHSAATNSVDIFELP